MTNALAAVVAVVAAVGAIGAGGAAAAPGGRYTPGAEGAGDVYYPYAGNGGYDVEHYDLEIAYAPPAPLAVLEGRLDGVATIDLVATQDLDRLDLDLRGMAVDSLAIDGKPVPAIDPPTPGAAVEGAAYWQVQDDDAGVWELVVQPRPKLKAGQEVRLVVEYGGPTGVMFWNTSTFKTGWVTTPDGGIASGLPSTSMTWYPVSDHPTDKATYSFEITVPEGKTAVANGLPSGDPVTEAGWTTWRWDAPDAQASYLTTVAVGDYELQLPVVSHDGVPILDYLDEDVTGIDRAVTTVSLSRVPGMLDLFSARFGPYPFASFGAIVDDDGVGYAMETQTRPIYAKRTDEFTVAHELAHQWFGNAVSPERWRDVWLSEGWATYLEWMWWAERAEQPVQVKYDEWYGASRSPEYWEFQVGDPGPTGLFDGQVYDRGAAAVHALRVEVGDEAFFEAARLWLQRHGDSTGTTEDFQAVYEEVAGTDLDEFFQVWLFDQVKPPATWTTP
ncbi:M1 family metallopeptidase [Agromyces sp. NPDC058064]|uniref:M1 family metallopeptidase n=1 Tax=Agromyces sp. NPDC058064 TaxID=3346322 RepID=UPI0036D9DFDD